MLASVAQGTSRVEGFASSADCWATVGCVRELGIPVERDGEALLIHGRGLKGYDPPSGKAVLDAGNSGSTIRMISGLLAAQGFTSIIDGDESLRRRPMGRIIEPLSAMGGHIRARDGRFAPLEIQGRPLKAIDFSSPVASAQVKTCALFAGLYADGTTTFVEPSPSRNHTELMLGEFGARLKSSHAGGKPILSVEGGAELRPVYYRVPGDFSSAAFFIAAATLLPGSELVVRRVSLNPSRTAFIDVLNGLGGNITRENAETVHGEAVGDLRIRSGRLNSGPDGALLSGGIIANLIDEVPILAVLGTQVEGRFEIRGARELRVKESDRITTVVRAIRAMRGEIEEFEDGFAVEGPQRLRGAAIETSGDHRIAMAFSVAGLLAEGSTDIIDADCASVSFPEFYDLLASLTGESAIEA
jgi:3-phosphoshikimate 1-carboxyvinyltransferase